MNKYIENILLYVGTIGAIISAIAYIVVMGVLVNGISTQMALEQLVIVSAIGAIAGLMIAWMLRAQGVAFASGEENSKSITAAYHKAINKTKPVKKLHTIKWHILWSSVKDVLFKGITVAASTYFMVSIFMEGNGDWSLMGLAAANICMFIAMGLLAMRKAYRFYLDEHLASLVEITNKLNELALIPVEGEIHGSDRQHKVLELTTTSREEPQGHNRDQQQDLESVQLQG